jgi:bifunctional DNA-binding transcriptional regulator/antitoxin component of YhaV-PrlF toxin-antitoxin module
VDDFGRVVLPKTVRSILGMERRTALNPSFLLQGAFL